MSDQSWAVLIGFLTVAGLRLLDWFLPKGRYSNWAARHSRDDDDGPRPRELEEDNA